MTELGTRGARFSLTGWQVADGGIRFAFDCSRFGAFEERVWFPDIAVPDAPDAGLCRLLDLLHVALGVSAYKAAAAERVDLPALTPAGRAMAERLYTHGLAEFFVRAGLPYPPRTAFSSAREAAPSARRAARAREGAALVAFGGGKDSYVARAIVQEAGQEALLASVVMSDAVAEAIDRTAPEPVRFLRRSLDPKLRTLEGAYNGHVPITAINMLVLTIYARLKGHGAVIFANERSADEETMRVGGVPANHQDSKSSAFEALAAGAVAEADPLAPIPFSILRPYSEVWIARGFASLSDAHGRFTSCNRNFRLAGDAAGRWCGHCAKCAFTSLLLAPHLDRRSHIRSFEADMLNSAALLPYYEQLCGLGDQKPWDCVGTIDECRATLWQAGQSGDWRDSLAVRSLLPRVREEMTDQALAAAWDAALRPAPAPAVPEPYRLAAARLWP
ncbi:hypothetical protein [Parvularcula oceani]|uniref:hypothetical protein n=1 Tax=Parvularcula oceani TaxID=1247963 RepID=UPI00068AFFEC|nr:hypothetical protein [Parvularcula oceani]